MGVGVGVGVGVGSGGVGGVTGGAALDASRVTSKVAKVIIGSITVSEINDTKATFWALVKTFHRGSRDRSRCQNPVKAKLVKAIIKTV